MSHSSLSAKLTYVGLASECADLHKQQKATEQCCSLHRGRGDTTRPLALRMRSKSRRSGSDIRKQTRCYLLSTAILTCKNIDFLHDDRSS